jgi:hypothetical protein
MEFKSRFDITMIERQQLQNDIRNTFYWEQLQLPGSQMYTATEVERRLEIMQRVLGPTLGRLDSEWLQMTMGRGLKMQMRSSFTADGQYIPGSPIPEPPPEVIEMIAAGEELDVEYEGPLARAQRSSEVQAVDRTAVSATPVLQINPDSADVYDWDEWLRFIADRQGIPAKLVRDKSAVQSIRDAKTAAREEAAQAEKMGAMAEAAGKIAPLLKQPGGASGAPAEAAA